LINTTKTLSVYSLKQAHVFRCLSVLLCNTNSWSERHGMPLLPQYFLYFLRKASMMSCLLACSGLHDTNIPSSP